MTNKGWSPHPERGCIQHESRSPNQSKVIDTYDQALRPIAEKLSFELPVQAREPAGFPSVLCLGNHSSGKSSFINHLLGEDIQKTGLAPTDDGFTLITHGSQRESLDGHTVTSHPSLPWKNLERLGPAFLNRLKLKTIPNQLLTSFALIDSPGMIDAIGAANTREYDFAAGVRFFAEKADLILFFSTPTNPAPPPKPSAFSLRRWQAWNTSYSSF